MNATALMPNQPTYVDYRGQRQLAPREANNSYQLKYNLHKEQNPFDNSFSAATSLPVSQNNIAQVSVPSSFYTSYASVPNTMATIPINTQVQQNILRPVPTISQAIPIKVEYQPPTINSMPPTDFLSNNYISAMPLTKPIPPLPYLTMNGLPPKKGAGGRKRKPTEGMDQKKIEFLERNRQAALKCRLRKKRGLEDTQLKLHLLTHQNVELEQKLHELKQSYQTLNQFLQSHQNCPVYLKNISNAFQTQNPQI